MRLVAIEQKGSMEQPIGAVAGGSEGPASGHAAAPVGQDGFPRRIHGAHRERVGATREELFDSFFRDPPKEIYCGSREEEVPAGGSIDPRHLLDDANGCHGIDLDAAPGNGTAYAEEAGALHSVKSFAAEPAFPLRPVGVLADHRSNGLNGIDDSEPKRGGCMLADSFGECSRNYIPGPVAPDRPFTRVTEEGSAAPRMLI